MRPRVDADVAGSWALALGNSGTGCGRRRARGERGAALNGCERGALLGGRERGATLIGHERGATLGGRE